MSQFRRTASSGWSGVDSGRVAVMIKGKEYPDFLPLTSKFPGLVKKGTGDANLEIDYPVGCKIAWGKGPEGKNCAVIYPQSTAIVQVASILLARKADIPDRLMELLKAFDGPLPPDVAELIEPKKEQKKDITEPKKKKIIFDAFQEKIIEAFLSLIIHVVCMAGAGSGKSTLAREMVRRAREKTPEKVRNVLFLMFNSKNREETDLELRKLPPAFYKEGNRREVCSLVVHTFHSYGKSRISARFPGRESVKLQDGDRKRPKLDIVAEEAMDKLRNLSGLNEIQYAKALPASRDLTKKAKAANLNHTQKTEVLALITSPLAPVDLAGNDPDAVATIACGLLKICEPNTKESMQVIDFSDMPWWLSQGFAGIDVERYDVVFVDEAQDLCPAYHEIVRRLEAAGARIVIVGDSAQAINGWAGASSHSIPELSALIGKSTRGIQPYPMPINYRCSAAVIRKANGVPGWEGLRPCDEAPEGKTGEVNSSELLEIVQPGDALISRVNSVLIEWAMLLLEAGKPVRLFGGGEAARDITGIIEQVSRGRVMRLEDGNGFLAALDRYEESQTERLQNSPGMGMKLETIRNQAQCCRIIAARQTVRIHGRDYHLRTSADLIAVVNALVVDDKGSKERAINIMTGHRCKGLQFKRVFNLTPTLFPHPRSVGEEQVQQEFNLLGVVITRAELEEYDLLDSGLDEMP
jgi:UvrD/REP helicase N-terminal domain/UvrD-like helicase C-terminal domain